jgi:hypothetical protein
MDGAKRQHTRSGEEKESDSEGELRLLAAALPEFVES